MAVAKKTTSALRKSHGPKRNLFHNYAKGMRYQMSRKEFVQTGVEPKTGKILGYKRVSVLNKYNDFESFALAVMARGIKMSEQDLEYTWARYFPLPTHKAKDEFLKDMGRTAKE